MNEELLKYLVNLKFSLVHKAIERLPGLIQKPIKDLEAQMMRTFYNVSKDYVEKNPQFENKKAGGLKQVDVE